ncbi:MAG TPA: dicarboxylate/amino acid:cation symporter [Candidatus Angelobacter sp.]|nr:dicarboxylate/amino acid:cation symporter [Candidatus Angelobacter sp.]
MSATFSTNPPRRKSWYRILYLQVLMAVALGIVIGAFFPDLGKSLKPLGDGFIKLVKMMIAPIIFCTVVHGVASMGDLRKLGRVGIKTLIYFEAVSTLALIIGLIVVNVLKPGAGFNIQVQGLDPEVGRAYAQKAHSTDPVSFLLNIIPNTLFDAFVTGDLLQVLLVSGLTAFAISTLGDRRGRVLSVIDHASQIFFGIMRIVVRAAPLGALGAMAFTVGSYGLGALNRLVALMAGFYATAALFIFGVLGAIAAMSGFSIFRFLSCIREELLLVLGTSSSETALPGMIQKMRRLGCVDSTVGLVIPAGYSFNLDGTNIYMSMAAIFLAQATNTPLNLRDQIALMLVAMISSKGASGVTGAGFVTLAATLAVVPKIPLASLALLVGIDRFMSECRAVTNLIGNGVATLVISRWEREITAEALKANLRRVKDESSAS